MPLTAEQKERYKKAKRDKRAREKLEKEAKLEQQRIKKNERNLKSYHKTKMSAKKKANEVAKMPAIEDNKENNMAVVPTTPSAKSYIDVLLSTPHAISKEKRAALSAKLQKHKEE